MKHFCTGRPCVALAGCILVMGGCALKPPEALERQTNIKEAVRLQRARETDMNREWRNRPLSALQKAYGTPHLILAIPGGGNPPGFAVIYMHDVKAGCIDAFAVAHAQDPVVVQYHCR